MRAAIMTLFMSLAVPVSLINGIKNASHAKPSEAFFA
jgi:hypothetical protein